MMLERVIDRCFDFEMRWRNEFYCLAVLRLSVIAGDIH